MHLRTLLKATVAATLLAALGSHAFAFSKYPQKDMLCTYVIYSHFSGFPHGKINN